MKMRFLIILLVLAAVLCSCVVVPEAETDTKDAVTSVPKDSDSATNADANSGIMLPYETGPGYGQESVKTEFVGYEYKYADMSLRVVEGWEFEIIPYTDDSTPFGVKINPENKPEEIISIMYYPTGFGVCGTGLVEEDTEISYFPAKKGFYDGSQIWNYIAANDYAITNEMADGTYGLYQDDIELMVGSVEIAVGVITPAEAIEIATDKLIDRFGSIEYTTTDFNYISGIWEVTVYMDADYSICGAKVYVSSLGTFIAEEIFAIVD